MRSVEESIKELKDQITKLDGLIKMGDTFIHMIDTAADGHSSDDLTAHNREDYISIMKDIAESRALKKDLELMLQAAKSIINNAAAYGLTQDEHKTDTEVDVDE